MNKTVFILGAGASIPFGYPSGKSLIEMIILSLHSEYRFHFGIKERDNQTGRKNERSLGQNFTDYQLYIRHGFSPKVLNKFKVSLANSNKNSIDSFLLERKEFMELGKIAIANSLLKYEKPTELSYLTENWLNYLWNKINLTLSDFENSNLAFITFNYDRLLEQYFYLSLKHAFDIPDKKVNEVLSNIPIIHLHGTLGFLPWQENPDSFDYKYEYNDIEKHYSNVLKAAKNIKIIYDESIDTSPFQQAKELIYNSKMNYMLGLGFHPLNIERLELQTSPKEIYCSAYGLTRHEVYQVMGKYNKLKLDDKNRDNLEFLRNYYSSK